MAVWALTDIVAKVRAITGRPDESMMSNNTITDYVNKFYQYVLPKELKIFWGYTYYKFFTTAGVDQYLIPLDYLIQTVNPQVYCDGFPIEWYLDPDTFYQDYPQQLNKQVVATGNGSQTLFAFNISAYPVLPRSVYISYNSASTQQIAQDNGVGSFEAPFSGSINYTTGAVSISLTPTPVSGTNITVTSQTYLANRPQGVLYYRNIPLTDSLPQTKNSANFFVLRPVPDQAYLVKMQCIQVPAPFTNNTDQPFRMDLGPLIAYGASIEIFSDFNQTDQITEIMPQYLRYKDVSMQDTYEEYLYQRSVPAF